MHYLLKTLAMGFIVAMGMAGCAATSQKTASPYLTDNTVLKGGFVSLTVHGMGCPLCATNVDIQLKKLKGVMSVNTNLNNGEVRILISPDEAPTRSDLAGAIHRAGLTLVEISS